MMACMTTLKYRFHYDDSQTRSDPFAIDKSAAEIEKSFEELPRDVRRRLEDSASDVHYASRKPGDRDSVLVVQTRDTEEHARAVIEAAGRSRGLTGQRQAE
jgi:hypothetical protein